MIAYANLIALYKSKWVLRDVINFSDQVQL